MRFRKRATRSTSIEAFDIALHRRMSQIRKYVSSVGNLWVWTNDGNMLVNNRWKHTPRNLACPRKCYSVSRDIEQYVAGLKYHSLQTGRLFV